MTMGYRAETASPVEPRLCTVRAAAEALAVSDRTVRKFIQDGSLRSVKVGGRRLVPTSALDEFVDTALAGEGAA